jgi:NhaP-type Na+/H+ or K+/H+ antiporter
MQATTQQQLTGMQTLTLTSPASDYVGFKVTSYVVFLVPIIGQVDSHLPTPAKLAIYAACGLIGSLLAIFGDTPKNKQDWIMRMLTGILSAILFGGAAIRRAGYNLKDNFEDSMMVLGILGATSWYVVGTVTKLLIYWQQSGSLADFLKLWFRGWAAFLNQQQTPKEEQK